MSGIDLSQFHQVFFEESLEGLDVMEASLLELDLGNINFENINDIFRAAHSIKGGSGTFGFGDIADFTHVLETLLDEIRSGQRQMEKLHVDLLLESVDCVRAMIAELQKGGDPDKTHAQELKTKFEAILANQLSGEVADSDASEETEVTASDHNWLVEFLPGQDILKSGNEPYRIINELIDLGMVELTLDVSGLPNFDELDPECLYLSWQFQMSPELDEQLIREPFEWVIDESTLNLDRMEPVNIREPETETSAQKLEDPQSSLPAKETGQTAQAKGAEPDSSESTQKKVTKQESSSIRVGIDKIDSLINMVGELVITQSMLGQLGKDFDMGKLSRLHEGLSQLEHHTRELQENVMRIRMLPISFTFSRFPRLVRDLCHRLNKEVDLKLLGENTELDKTVMEKIGDPLVHMVRNSLDHGLESPEERVAAGKPKVGQLTLNAFHYGGNIVIEIIDDGRGIPVDKIREKGIAQGLISDKDEIPDEQIRDLIFHPGFSTAESVSDVSGRGVGMDVVRKNIQELNGSVEVESTEGKGSTFRIRLPLTLAILDGQLVRVGNQTYIIPLISIVESIQVNTEMVNAVGSGMDVLRLRNEYIPIVRLFEMFAIDPDSRELKDGLLVVVEGDNQKVGVVVDELLTQQQVVIKSLEANYRPIDGVSGATILGDGTVALILDIPGLLALTGNQLLVNRPRSGGEAA